MHQAMAADDGPGHRARSRRIQRDAREGRATGRPTLADDRAAHAEGLDRPEGGRRPARSRARSARTRCRWPRSATNPDHLRAARGRGCGAIGPRSCSTRTGALVPELAALPPKSYRRMSANPHANGGLLLRDLRPARLPRVRRRRADDPARRSAEATRVLGAFLRDVIDAATRTTFRLFGPDETASNRLGAVFEVTDRALDGRDPAHRRAPRARRPGHGGAVGAPLPGLAGGLPADRPARPVQLLRGVHPHRRLDVQPAREVAEGHAPRSRGAARSRRSTTC